MANFAADVTRFVKKTGIKADLVLRKIGFDGLSGVIYESPVLTGRFRGNWRVGINRVDTSTDESTDLSGRSTLFKGSEIISGARFGDTIHISNNLPYAKRIEEGWSKVKAPLGVLGPTVKMLQLRINTIIARAKL